MNFMDGYTSNLLEQYTKKMDELLRYKLILLSNKAFVQGEYDLYEILRDIEIANLENVKQKLIERGYTLEFEQPPVDFTNSSSIFRATIDTTKCKLRVKKTLYEV